MKRMMTLTMLAVTATAVVGYLESLKAASRDFQEPEPGTRTWRDVGNADTDHDERQLFDA